MDKKKLPWLVLVSILLILPWTTDRSYYQHLFNMAIVYAILAVGLNFCIGLTGIMSIAQGAFWGIGAYTSAILTVRWGLPFWVGLPASALVAAIIGMVLGLPCLRVSGLYLSMVTIGFAELVRLVLWNWDKVTRGSFGIVGIPSPVLGPWQLDTPRSYYYLSLFIAGALVAAAVRIQHSRTGRAMLAIREDELAALCMGINVPRYKTLAFMLSAAYGGTAGSIYAHFVQYINPDMYTFPEAVKQISMVVLGGAGSVPGVILGSTIVVLLPEWLRFLQEYYMAVYGLGVVLIIRYMPGGLIQILQTRFWFLTETLPAGESGARGMDEN